MKALNLTKHIYLGPHPEISHFTICQTCPDLNTARAVTLEHVAFLIYELGLWFWLFWSGVCAHGPWCPYQKTTSGVVFIFILPLLEAESFIVHCCIGQASFWKFSCLCLPPSHYEHRDRTLYKFCGSGLRSLDLHRKCFTHWAISVILTVLKHAILSIFKCRIIAVLGVFTLPWNQPIYLLHLAEQMLCPLDNSLFHLPSRLWRPAFHLRPLWVRLL